MRSLVGEKTRIGIQSRGGTGAGVNGAVDATGFGMLESSSAFRIGNPNQ